MPDPTKSKGTAPPRPRRRLRGNRGKGLSELLGEHRLDAEEVEKLRRVRLPPTDGRSRLESLDHLWAAVGRFGLSEVAEGASVEPARLRDALADLASEEIEVARSPVRRSLGRWRRRWPWRLTAILVLLILAAGSVYLEARQSRARSQTRVIETLPSLLRS